MRILLTLVLVSGTMAIQSTSADAQIYNDGYQWGAGFRQSSRCQTLGRFGFGSFLTPRSEEPPYFATFPPVYYNGIVSRPYGISPYAAPSGIVPVEMTVPQTLTIPNPYFENEVVPEPDQSTVEPATVEENGNRVTWQTNPYMESFASRNDIRR